MNKTKLIALLIALTMGGACYRKSSTETNKPIATTTGATPTAVNSVESPAQTSKGGDYDAALNFYNAKSYSQAVSEFNEVVKKDAKNQQAHFYLGKSHQALNKNADAVSAYKKAIEIKPDYAEANYELGSIYLKQRDFQTALPYIEKAAKINYKSVDYLIALGDNYRELKKCEYAVVPYGEVNGFDDKNTAAYYGMGLCYIELKNRIAAGQQVRNLEKLDKKLSEKLAAQISK